MEETWRWFGPTDTVRLCDIDQTGARGIVTALHHLPVGEVWSEAEIATRQAEIESGSLSGLRWSVVESLPVHEDIKRGSGNLVRLFSAYRDSLRNLARRGLRTVCYNFMPVLDWTRTQLRYPLHSGGTALRFNHHEIAAFDCYLLKRPDAEEDYPPAILERASAWIKAAKKEDRETLIHTVIAGLPGTEMHYDLQIFREMLAHYSGIDVAGLRANLKIFLQEIVPAAADLGIRLCIHPDDPPIGLFGLPRIVSNEEDISFLLSAVDNPANGLTFCTGSLGSSISNDVPAMARRFADRVWFAHLRNVTVSEDGSFLEAGHLGGDVDVVTVIRELMAAEHRRYVTGDPYWQISMRADHGHELLDDLKRQSQPGYPLIGRLRGLAELRGVMAAVAVLDRKN